MSCGVDLGGRRVIKKLCLWHGPATVAPIPSPSLGTSVCHRCGSKKQTKTKTT